MLTGNATTERALSCLTSAVQHGSGYGNAPTRRGGGDHVSKRQKRAWGAKQHAIAPKLHKRPHCRRAEHVWSEYIGVGMGGELGSDWSLHTSAGLTGSCCECCRWCLDQHPSCFLLNMIFSVKISLYPRMLQSRSKCDPLDTLAHAHETHVPCDLGQPFSVQLYGSPA